MHQKIYVYISKISYVSLRKPYLRTKNGKNYSPITLGLPSITVCSAEGRDKLGNVDA